MTSATAFPVFQIFLFLALSDLWVCLRFHTAFSPLVLCCLFLVSLSPAQGKSLSRVRVFATPWTVAYEVPPSMEFSRQEYWSALPFPSPGHLPHPESNPCLQHLLPWQMGSLPVEPLGLLLKYDPLLSSAAHDHKCGKAID